ncbi:helix-turn-helix domain-containing protein [Mediterraneibacter gnavus]|uniref:Helix-turn-helix transcriptional regulator n=1 Tax=Mediterraneibacter gnavus TaxID=33038 RepID=A0A9X3HHG6_MEDGN|nr:helix-turn-helix transcriptional regulator [Mediterraneibacter gnavus]MCZ7694804.1 helix-turn-helix transcriptional regulator [Mediterraneibacter gnavus]MCZ7736328.1 helix-turn-helix transcriptional regulator [Mediterraneibacter gnavus]MDC6147995.1 helix-turn-helix transcriptional regulator [Mediterraneibacter gnavus]MDE1201412.1 helix-turn-helix transcriptional regulator [Mediterraneibacter gnavus]
MGNRAVSQELIILGNRIREYRKERGFSQEILAEKSGVSTNTISRIEGGQMAMSVGILQKIVKALGVDANTLLGVSTEVNETKIWVSAFSSRVQELKENEQKILKHTMNALIESMEKNRLKISTDKSSQVLHTR